MVDESAALRAARWARTEYEARFLGALIACNVECCLPGIDGPLEIEVDPDQAPGSLRVDIVFLRTDAPAYDAIALHLAPGRVIGELDDASAPLDVAAEEPEALARAAAEWVRATLDPPRPPLEFELD